LWQHQGGCDDDDVIPTLRLYWTDDSERPQVQDHLEDIVTHHPEGHLVEIPKSVFEQFRERYKRVIRG
jgi:hypothetical protein